MKHQRLLGLLAAACTAAVSLNCEAGWEFTQVMTSDSPRSSHASGGGAQGNEVKSFVEGASARFDFQSPQGPVAAGSYFLTTDAGATVHMVNPADRTYTKWSMEMLGAMMQMMKMQVSDYKSEKTLDEAGETLLGHRTRHYRFVSSYTLSMSMMGMSHSTEIRQEDEMWVAPDLADGGFSAWAKTWGSRQSGDENLDKLLRSRLEDVKGFPLKTVSKRVSTSNGREEASTTTVMVTHVAKKDMPASYLQIPAGFSEIEMPAMKRERGLGGRIPRFGTPPPTP